MQARRRSTRRTGMPGSLRFYFSVLLYMLIMSLIYAAGFAPLAALFLFKRGSSLQYLALLCPALLIFVLMPLRFSFAQAMIGRYSGEAFTLRGAFNFSLYGEKVAEGFKYLLHLLKWLIPLIAGCAVLVYLYDGGYEFTQTIISLNTFGKAVTNGWNAFINFFTGLFGGTPLTAAGGIAEAFIAIFAILGLFVLIFILGLVRNSAYRYIWAGATRLDKDPRPEARRSLRGRRFEQLFVSILNLVLLMPAIIVLYLLLEPKETISDIAMNYANALAAETPLPAVVIPYGKLAVVFFGLYLPFLPLRRRITAHFATMRIRQMMRPHQPVATNTDPMPQLYQDRLPQENMRK